MSGTIDFSSELNQKLLNAQSAEQIVEIVKEDGQEIDEETAEHLFKELEHHRNSDKELSTNELEAVNGGKRDYIKDGCAATVEPGSWCGSDDRCEWFDVRYTIDPYPDQKCPECGEWMYLSYEDYYYHCRKCGYKQFSFINHVGW